MNSVIRNAQIFDGDRLLQDHASKLQGFLPRGDFEYSSIDIW